MQDSCNVFSRCCFDFDRYGSGAEVRVERCPVGRRHRAGDVLDIAVVLRAAGCRLVVVYVGPCRALGRRPEISDAARHHVAVSRRRAAQGRRIGAASAARDGSKRYARRGGDVIAGELDHGERDCAEGGGTRDLHRHGRPGRNRSRPDAADHREIAEASGDGPAGPSQRPAGDRKGRAAVVAL